MRLVERKRNGRGWINVRVERRALGVPTALSDRGGRMIIVLADVEVKGGIVNIDTRGEGEKNGDDEIMLTAM